MCPLITLKIQKSMAIRINDNGTVVIERVLKVTKDVLIELVE